jgi:phosphomethylpyrimidine synthase
MTQLESARQGVVTKEMRRVAVRECVSPEFIRDEVARGRLVIPANLRHLAGSSGVEPDAVKATNLTYSDESPGHPGAAPGARLWVNQTIEQRTKDLDDPNLLKGQNAPKRLDPMGIGRMITTKINANLGASPLAGSVQEELEKTRCALRYGADTIMDLSTGGPLNDCRQNIIDHCSVPVGTVPIYSMIVNKPVEELTHDDILKTVEKQAAQGVDFFTIHAGLLREHLFLLERRQTGLVSRGGALLAKWMKYHERQNPMYVLFDDLSAILHEYDATYSLGDGVRPGSLRDAGDPAQLAELEVLGELTFRAREKGVQVMVEGPGHVPLHEVAWHMSMQQKICDDAPFYVLGPLVTDVFPGYDHITSCVGATEAARAGAAMLCAVTPREHLALPRVCDVRDGCIAYKIAAHAGDIARGIAGARAWDEDMSRARAALDWNKQFALAFDGENARRIRAEHKQPETDDFCSMCGKDWCSLRISREVLQRAEKPMRKS